MEKHLNHRINTPPPPPFQKKKKLQTFIPKKNKGKESFLPPHNFCKTRNENFALLWKKKSN